MDAWRGGNDYLRGRLMARSTDETFAVDPAVGAQGGRSTRDHFHLLMESQQELGTLRLACQALAQEMRRYQGLRDIDDPIERWAERLEQL